MRETVDAATLWPPSSSAIALAFRVTRAWMYVSAACPPPPARRAAALEQFGGEAPLAVAGNAQLELAGPGAKVARIVVGHGGSSRYTWLTPPSSFFVVYGDPEFCYRSGRSACRHPPLQLVERLAVSRRSAGEVHGSVTPHDGLLHRGPLFAKHDQIVLAHIAGTWGPQPVCT